MFALTTSLAVLVLATTSTLAGPTTTTTTGGFKQPLSDFANTRCSDGHKLGTPTYGTQGVVFTICAELEIHASVQEIYDALLDFSEYKNWNSFVVDVVARPGKTPPPPGPVGVGFGMTFTTQGLLPAGLNSTSDECVTLARKDVLGDGKVAVLGWKFEGNGPKSEHPNVLVDLGAGVTRYVSWESFYGPAAPLVQTLEKNLEKQFQAQGEDLKRLVEA